MVNYQILETQGAQSRSSFLSILNTNFELMQ